MNLFSRLLTDWGNQKGSPSLKCLTYPTMMTLGKVIPYPKKIQKVKNHVTHHLSSANISTFSPKIRKFCYAKKYSYRVHLKT